MNMPVGVAARLLVRVLSMALVGWGVLRPDDAAALALDPDLIAVVALALSEIYHIAARQFGWPT